MTLTPPSRRAVRCVLITLLTSGLAACAGIGQPSASDRLATAQAMFAQRCQTAGEKIYRTVDNVEGIYLLKLRPTQNFGGQFDLDDPYGNDLSGDGYIESFLRGSFGAGANRTFVAGAPSRFGYRYVEAIDQKDGNRYRYTGSTKVVGRKDAAAYNVQIELKSNPSYDLNIYAYVLERTVTTGPTPRYGVTYDDVSTREEREYWIAGSSLKVIDLQTNEVIAERVGYMIDQGQGGTSGGRAPWQMAADHACPSFFRNPNYPPRGPAFAVQARQTEDFVEKVLKPLP